MSALTGRRVGIPVPENGIQLPVGEEGDLTPWAESIARSRLPYDASPEQITAYATRLLSATAGAEERGVTMAVVYAPFPGGAEIARIELRDFAPDDLHPTIPDLPDIAAWLTSPLAGAMEEPELTYGETPLGPAARLKLRTLTDESGEGVMTILNTAIYLIRPREYECVIMLSVTWAAGAFTAQLDELADRLAQQVEMA